jgi:hypothetical protein
MHHDDERWDELLRHFTTRNAQRRTRLEVDDPEIGAQVEETGHAFRGASYDFRTRSVEIMLGELGTPEGHLTRAIHDVRDVDVLTGDDGHDQVLRIAHGDGQTLLRLI